MKRVNYKSERYEKRIETLEHDVAKLKEKKSEKHSTSETSIHLSDMRSGHAKLLVTAFFYLLTLIKSVLSLFIKRKKR